MPVGLGRVTEATIGFGSDSVSFGNWLGGVASTNLTRPVADAVTDAQL